MERKIERKRVTYLLIFILAFLPYFLISYFYNYKKPFTLYTLIDSKIPFISFFVLFYLFCYLWVIFPFFICEKKKLKNILVGYLSIFLICYIFYLILPIEMIRPEPQGLFAKLITFIYEIDKGYTTFPSLHVSTTMFSLFSLLTSKKINKNIPLSLILSVLTILIILSTLFIKQHYFFDVVTGVFIGTLTGIVIFRHELKIY